MGGFSPRPGSAAASAPLPPLPDLPAAPDAGGGGSASADPSGFLSSVLSGIAPVKMAVDQIHSACQQIVQSGSVPGAEQICGQIVALASSLLPMAAQQALQPAAGGSAIGMMAPPGLPAPVGGGGPPGGGPGIPGM